MIAFARLLSPILMALSLALWLATPRCFAQEDNPFGADAPDDAPAAPAAAPAAAARPTSKDKPEEETPRDEPAVIAVLESNPKTPDEKLRAAQILVDLDRPDLAKRLLGQLLKPAPQPKTAYETVRRFGSAALFRIAREEKLAPEGQEVADAMLAAAEKYRNDPKRLNDLVGRLANPSPAIRDDARADLEEAHERAVAPLVRVLADPSKAALHPAVRDLLVDLQDDAVPPLLGALEGGDAQLKVHVIDVLGQLGARDAIDSLLLPLLSPKSSTQLKAAAERALLRIVGSTPSLRDAQTQLRRDVTDRLDRSRIPSEDPNATVDVWQWNDKQKQSVPVKYGPMEAELAIAARLGRDLVELDPTNVTNRRLYLTGLLESAKFSNGLDKPLASGAGSPYAIAAAMGVDAMDDFLAYALTTDRNAAATAAAQILGDIGSPALLERTAAEPSPLARAARSGDPRLRFTAMDAILKLKPTRTFAGSSAVSEALGFFAASGGVRRALVGYPNAEEAQRLVGFLAELGYECDAWTTSRRLFEMATTSPDYEFALFHTALRHPPVEELVVQLRRDPRTATLPIGLIAISGDMPRAKYLATRAGLALAFPRPHDAESVKFDASALNALAGRNLLLPEERQRHAAAALDWLAALSEKQHSPFELRRQLRLIELALYVPQHSAKAAEVVGNLGTADGQHALVELAASTGQPLEIRQAAANAFRRSVQRYGLLLTHDQIVTQHDRYNANAGENQDTHTVLNSVLDTIEAKQATNEAGGQRQ